MKITLFNPYSRNKNISATQIIWRILTGLTLFVWVFSIGINIYNIKLEKYMSPTNNMLILNYWCSIILSVWMTFRIVSIIKNSPYFKMMFFLISLGSILPIITIIINNHSLKILGISLSMFLNIIFFVYISISMIIISLIEIKKIKGVFITSLIDFICTIILFTIANIVKEKYGLWLMISISFLAHLSYFLVNVFIIRITPIWDKLSIILIVGVIGLLVNTPVNMNILLKIKIWYWILFACFLFIVPLVINIIFRKKGSLKEYMVFLPVILLFLMCMLIFYQEKKIVQIEKIKYISYLFIILLYISLHMFNVNYNIIINKKDFMIQLLIWIMFIICIYFLEWVEPHFWFRKFGINVQLSIIIFNSMLHTFILAFLILSNIKWASKRKRKEKNVNKIR